MVRFQRVIRNTPLNMSAAPATTNPVTASHNVLAAPNTTIPQPQAAAAAASTMARPRRWIRIVQPLRNETPRLIVSRRKSRWRRSGPRSSANERHPNRLAPSSAVDGGGSDGGAGGAGGAKRPSGSTMWRRVRTSAAPSERVHCAKPRPISRLRTRPSLCRRRCEPGGGPPPGRARRRSPRRVRSGIVGKHRRAGRPQGSAEPQSSGCAGWPR
jgi:hypothetical protein